MKINKMMRIKITMKIKKEWILTNQPTFWMLISSNNLIKKSGWEIAKMYSRIFQISINKNIKMHLVYLAQ